MRISRGDEVAEEAARAATDLAAEVIRERDAAIAELAEARQQLDDAVRAKQTPKRRPAQRAT
jgi:hypothetical protein